MSELQTSFIQAWNNGDYSEAIKFISLLIEEQPNHAVHLLNRAQCYEKLELFRKCLKDCDTALECDPSAILAYLIKGRAYAAMGKQDESTRTFKLGSNAYGPIDIVSALAKAAAGKSDSPQVSYSTPTSSMETRSASSTTSSSSPFVQPSGVASREEFFVNSPSTSHDAFELDESLSKAGSDLKNLGPKALEALVGVASKGMVQHGVGNANIDQQIALGYLQVNTGNYAAGIRIFSGMLQQNPKVVAAYLGRGTAYALSGDLESASRDFSSAISVDPKCVDAYKRRGQTRAARGQDAEGLKDFDMAITLQKDHEVYHQRGLIYYKQKNYKRALDDFVNASKFEHSNKMTWNYMGLCYNALGQSSDASEAYLKALSLDPSFKEAYCNMGIACKDWGKADKALEYFEKALKLDATYVSSNHVRALTWFGLGRHDKAIEDFSSVLYRDTGHFEARWMRAVAYHDVGLFKKSINDFDKALELKPDHFCWYQKQLALFYQHNLDTPFSEYNIDQSLDPMFKEFWCKRTDPSEFPKKQQTTQKPLDPNIPDVVQKLPDWPAPTRKLLEYAWDVGKWMHQDAPGFLMNFRQIKMGGLGAVEMAQVLRDVITGKLVQVSGKYSSGDPNPHKFGWRDLFDIPVRWRQYSEPNDPVWWVDQLTPEQFSEGFGSHTPIITGQCVVVRYGPMFKRAFPIMKALIKEQHVLSDDMLRRLEKAETCEDLYKIMRRDFWVVTPCHSTAKPGKIMEGTRLTLQFSPPEGYEFSIRTPGTPPRWIDYSLELDYVFDKYIEAARKTPMDNEEVSKWILTLAFYWYNFMPLARGTAATGYVAILGLFLGAGIKLRSKIPENVLTDWDGILLPTTTDFIKAVSPWILKGRTPYDVKELEEIPRVDAVFSTIRKTIEALNDTIGRA